MPSFVVQAIVIASVWALVLIITIKMTGSKQRAVIAVAVATVPLVAYLVAIKISELKGDVHFKPIVGVWQQIDDGDHSHGRTFVVEMNHTVKLTGGYSCGGHAENGVDVYSSDSKVVVSKGYNITIDCGGTKGLLRASLSVDDKTLRISADDQSFTFHKVSP
jgi:hypothetical protein